MASSRSKTTATRAKFRVDLAVAARLALVALALTMTSLGARAAGGALSQLDQQCLA